MKAPDRRSPIADDGDELHFCSTCAFSAACIEQGYDKSQLRELHVLVEHIGPFRESEHIFREGDPFNAIAAVRGGTVKTYVTDTEGREQVQGFFLPGEVIGLNAISQARYPCNAVALDSVVLSESRPESLSGRWVAWRRASRHRVAAAHTARGARSQRAARIGLWQMFRSAARTFLRWIADACAQPWSQCDVPERALRRV